MISQRRHQGTALRWKTFFFNNPRVYMKIVAINRRGRRLASARSRSGSDNTPCCHSRPSRRFATSAPRKRWIFDHSRTKDSLCKERGTPHLCGSPLPSHGLAFTLLWRFRTIGEFRPLRRATNAPRVGSAPPFEKGGRKLSPWFIWPINPNLSFSIP